jgi:hypothetical protein
MKLAHLCSRCPACSGESADRSTRNHGHLKSPACPFKGRRFSNYGIELQRFLFHGVSLGKAASAAYDDWLDVAAERRSREEEQEKMRRDLAHAFEQHENAQRVTHRAKLARIASDVTREAGLPEDSAPMPSISSASLHKPNNMVLMTTITPICVLCDIPMKTSKSQYGLMWMCPNFWNRDINCRYFLSPSSASP